MSELTSVQKKLNIHVEAFAPNGLEIDEIKSLILSCYSGINGFPTKKELPEYYKTINEIQEFLDIPTTEIILAKTGNKIIGSVVFIGDIKYYISGKNDLNTKNSSGFRLLSVHKDYRKIGVGKLLSNACITKARKLNKKSVIIHTTKHMKVAWEMYIRMGFKSNPKYNFTENKILKVYCFELILN